MTFRTESYRILAHPLLAFVPGLLFLIVLGNATAFFLDLERIPLSTAIMGPTGLVVESVMRAIRRAQARRGGTQSRLREIAFVLVAGYLLGSFGRIVQGTGVAGAAGPLDVFSPGIGNIYPTVAALAGWFLAFAINGRLIYHDRFLSLTQGLGENELYLAIRNNADIGRAFYFTMKTLRAIYSWLAIGAIAVHLLAHAVSEYADLSVAPPRHFAAVVLVLVTIAARTTVRIIAEKGYTESLGVSVSRRLESRRIIVAIAGVLLLAPAAMILTPSRPIVPAAWLDAFFSWLASLFTSQPGKAVEQAPTFADFERMRAYLNELSAYQDSTGPPEWLQTLAVVLRTILIVVAIAAFVGFMVYPLFTRRRGRARHDLLRRRILSAWYEFLRFVRKVVLFVRLLGRRIRAGGQSARGDAPSRSASSPITFDRKRRRQSRRLDRLFMELVTSAKKAHIAYHPTDSLSDFLDRASRHVGNGKPGRLLTLFYRGRYGPSGLNRAELHTLTGEVRAFAKSMSTL